MLTVRHPIAYWEKFHLCGTTRLGPTCFNNRGCKGKDNCTSLFIPLSCCSQPVFPQVSVLVITQSETFLTRYLVWTFQCSSPTFFQGPQGDKHFWKLQNVDIEPSFILLPLKWPHSASKVASKLGDTKIVVNLSQFFGKILVNFWSITKTCIPPESSEIVTVTVVK